ncbi:MAG TPA: polyribonucleotide nucleotidyltransferase [Candidatus Brocadiia bacterium]|nr:polyribonucleotide nucleotidyltransferase [Candidatus Brocadiia bacterium]
MQSVKVTRTIGGRELTIETGKLAKQADGAVLVTYADTVILATAQSAPAGEDTDFFPLTVDYREKQYAAGKIPGGIIKREGRPTTKEILTMRLIDRSIRPLFPDNYRSEVQIMVSVLSADRQNEPDTLALIGAGAALAISTIPFDGPVAGVRMGRVDGNLVVNPTYDQLQTSDMDMVIAGTAKSVDMIECCGQEVSEDQILEAIWQGHEVIKDICDAIQELAELKGKPKQDVPAIETLDALTAKLAQRYAAQMKQACNIAGKHARASAIDALVKKVIEEICGDAEDAPEPKKVAAAMNNLESEVLRDQVITEERRYDGRAIDEVRDIECEVGVLPRTHGSALFTRGETQALVITTLGTTSDEQRVLDPLTDELPKKFMLHYNFPPFSVGEVRSVRSASRREIGHGELAERALRAVQPPPTKFPYTVRIVSDILESNGSSSMASVCGATLSLMDAGVPISDPVAGVAMGLVGKGGVKKVLTDIAGAEDHFGDMDFKIAGTQRGVTAMQMDVKITGIDRETMSKVLTQARKARMQILRRMLETLQQPRESISPHAPRLIMIQINPEKIGSVIGPGGKVIRALQEETGTKIEIEDDGSVMISSLEAEGAERCADIIRSMTEEVQIGKIYNGRVVSIRDFGAFIEILPNTDGLCHISELADGFVKRVEDVIQVGQEVSVKVIDIDDQNRIRLSRKEALREGRRPPQQR